MCYSLSISLGQFGIAELAREGLELRWAMVAVGSHAGLRSDLSVTLHLNEASR